VGDRGHQIGGRRDPVTDEEDHRARLESAHGFADVADREHSDSIEPKAFERILKRLRHSLYDDNDGGSASGGGTAHLIFDERSPGERKQRSKAALIVLLIGADERAER